MVLPVHSGSFELIIRLLGVVIYYQQSLLCIGMKFKLSNTNTLEALETFTGLKLRYPKLYEPKPLIAGVQETILPIIVSNEAKHIEYGIWGMLPENYDENWEDFQNVIDTLTVVPVSQKEKALYLKTTELKRAVVLVSGFFTTFLYKGKTYPFYVYASDKKPFYIATYYNTLNDGFMSFSIVVSRANRAIKKIQNLSSYSPKVLSKSEKEAWLFKNTPEDELKKIVETETTVKLKYHGIAKELFKMGVSYTTMLEPRIYEEIQGLT